MKKMLLLAVAALILLLGCSLVTRDFYLDEEDFPNDFKGTLLIALDASQIPTSRTIVPAGFDMNADLFDLTFDFLDIAGTVNDFAVSNYDSTTYIANGLTPGNWNVAITAKNDSGTAVGAIGGAVTNAVSFTISAGAVTALGPSDVVIIPLDGQGSLSMHVVWPADMILTSAGIDAYLVPWANFNILDNAFDPSAYPIAPALSIAGSEATYGSPTPVATDDGYYALFLYLKDDGTRITGMSETVRIITGQQSHGEINLTIDSGGITITPEIDLNNPVGIVFTPLQPPLPVLGAPGAYETQLTVTATLAFPSPESDVYRYRWYLDGEIDDPDATGTVTPVSSTGVVEYTLLASGFSANDNHHLSLIVTGETSGGVVETLSSDTYDFAVSVE